MTQDKENEVGFLLARSTNLIWKHLNRNFLRDGYDVTPEQFSVLMKLYFKNRLSQKEIAEMLFKDKVSVTKIVNSLEKRGLVTRVSDKNDKRIKRIELTSKAKRIIPNLHESAHKTLDSALKNTDKVELEVFKTVLRNIHTNLSV